MAYVQSLGGGAPPIITVAPVIYNLECAEWVTANITLPSTLYPQVEIDPPTQSTKHAVYLCGDRCWVFRQLPTSTPKNRLK